MTPTQVWLFFFRPVVGQGRAHFDLIRKGKISGWRNDFPATIEIGKRSFYPVLDRRENTPFRRLAGLEHKTPNTRVFGRDCFAFLPVCKRY